MRARRIVSTILLLLSLGSAASAHHILGIPHYKYDESYPQIPFVEILGQVGRHDLHFTYFPGTPQPGERVRFKLYAVDRETGEPVREPLEATVVRKTFLSGEEIMEGPFPVTVGTGPEGNDYKFYLSFDAAEAYEVRVNLPNGDGWEVVPFPVTIGETDDRPFILGAALILVLSVAVVGVVKRRRVAAPVRVAAAGGVR